MAVPISYYYYYNKILQKQKNAMIKTKTTSAIEKNRNLKLK